MLIVYMYVLADRRFFLNCIQYNPSILLLIKIAMSKTIIVSFIRGQVRLYYYVLTKYVTCILLNYTRVY
jgi:hypothetical protein